ncbi:M90 family metallopeptidase [Labilibacter marinus]|uniref:M90 family metallopeptidase n=1 Tax=Labilibacter marinus TaxID=1477105 RepID=UPI000832A15C|nr:M90 family metallopeptidase [Labilibacter marinus]
MTELLLIVLAIIILVFIIRRYKQPTWIMPEKDFPPTWRTILCEKVNYYNHLSKEEKRQFEHRVQEFLLNCKITGVDVEVDITDKLLVASSAIIPIFKISNWRYLNLNEVLLYPGMFNEKLETSGEDRRIMGMVGSGYMEGKMILSKPALHHGFSNASDKKNTAIHEFVHLIDKLDGSTDGVPSLLLENQYAIPWLDLINRKIEEIYEKDSDINPYGGTNKQEFFAVASEYFFERPKLLKQKHPELYQLLEEIFQQDLSTKDLTKTKTRSGRNSPCPCGSGLKFKKCCGKIG